MCVPLRPPSKYYAGSETLIITRSETQYELLEIAEDPTQFYYYFSVLHGLIQARAHICPLM
jgi:hypothetical protein